MPEDRSFRPQSRLRAWLVRRAPLLAAAALAATAAQADEPFIPEPLQSTFEVLDEKGALQSHYIDYLTPPGRLIDIGSHKLHMFCAGSGSPTVVLEAGLGGFSLEWLTVQQQLAGDYRVCAYDRAGYGWSQFGPMPRQASRIVQELNLLLDYSREPGPYVLVGHSFGGYIVQAFARRWPEKVAGMVLVDSSHPEQDRYLPVVAQQRRALVPGTRITSYSRPIVPETYPNSVRHIAYYLMGTRKAARTQREELRGMTLSGRQVIEAGPVPLNLSASVLSRSFDVAVPNTISGHSDDEALESTWQSLQANLGHLYGTEVLDARYSGHFVHLDQPWLVTESIQRVIARSCNGEHCLSARHGDSGYARSVPVDEPGLPGS